MLDLGLSLLSWAQFKEPNDWFAQIYCSLSAKLKRATDEKCIELVKRNIIFHQDYARVHGS